MTSPLLVPEQEYADRLARTQALMAEEGLEGLVVFAGGGPQGGHVRYLTNYRPPVGHETGIWPYGRAAFVLPVRGVGVLVALGEIDPPAVANLDSVRTGRDLVGQTAEVVQGLSSGDARWGVAGLDAVTTRRYFALAGSYSEREWRQADDLLAGQRSIKSETEQALLRRAARIGDKGLDAGMEAATPGATRLDVEVAVREGCLRAGAELVAGVDVCAGLRLEAAPLPEQSGAAIKEGELVSLRARGWAGGYAFDLSRVGVPLGANVEQLDYVQHLVEATAWMRGRMQPGERITYYPAESRGRMIEPRARGIGLDLGEEPTVRMRKGFTPQVGMVLCVAPVVAGDDFGSAAIRSMVVIRESGPEVLG